MASHNKEFIEFLDNVDCGLDFLVSIVGSRIVAGSLVGPTNCENKDHMS